MMEKNSCKLQVAGYGRTEDWNDGMMEEWKRIVTGYTLRVAVLWVAWVYWVCWVCWVPVK